MPDRVEQSDMDMTDLEEVEEARKRRVRRRIADNYNQYREETENERTEI